MRIFLSVLLCLNFFLTTVVNAQENIALTADAILTSYVSSWENLNAINDGYNPDNSSDKTGGAYGNWENGANADWEWVEYSWDELKEIYQSDIYWWTDGGGIQFPSNTYQQYWDVLKEEWLPLPNVSGNGAEADRYNVTTFDTILTNKIRVYAISTIATGILEWRVWGSDGEQIPTGSTCTIDVAFAKGTTSLISLKAIDKNGSPVAGYIFKYHIDILSTVPANAEEYIVNGTTYTSSTGKIELPVTNAQGEVSFSVVNPTLIDPKDGIQLRVFFNNGITQIGDTFKLFEPGLTPPTIVADITENTIDNNMEVSFTDNSLWRAAITEILVNGNVLAAGTDYDISAGVITLKPSGGNHALTVSGTKTVQVLAAGYEDAVFQQVILHGIANIDSTTVKTLLNLYKHTTTNIEAFVSDKFGNRVDGYVLKYTIDITNNTATTNEVYKIGGVDVSSDLANQLLLETDANGKSTLSISIPGVVDLNDGISIQFKLQDNSLVNPAITYINNGTEKEIVVQSAVKTNPDFTWDNSAQSENFVVFWGKKITGKPSDAANGSLAFDPNDILAIMESLLNYMTDSIGFIDNPDEKNMAKYKHEIVMNETWTDGSFTGYAFGGSIEDKIGGMWIHPGATGGPAVLAHEFTHMCQAMILLQYPGYGLKTDYAGFFWESHANYYMAQYSKTYTGVQIERYINTSMLHFSTTRHYYQNLYFIDHIADKYGLETTHQIWRKADPETSHPLTSLRDSVLRYTQDDLNDEFGEMAMKNVTWDYKNGNLIRKAIRSLDPMYIGREYTIPDTVNGHPDTYVVPEYLAPGDYGYNIIPLFPNDGAAEISIDFTGYENEPAGGAGWRYGFVAVNSAGAPRYGSINKDQSSTISFTLEPSDSAIFLVVTGAPDTHHNYGWTTGFPKEYRYPYSLKITGALPAGHKDGYNSLKEKTPGAPHANGGGWVASTATVAETAYVGPNAQVLGNAVVTENARIEDFAIIKGTAAIGGSANVKDNAIVGGSSKLTVNALVEKSARVYNTTLKDDVVITGSAMIFNSTISGSAKIKDLAYLNGVTLSGTVIVGGDAEEYTGCSEGTYLQMQTVRTSGCDGKINHKLNIDINPDWEIYNYPQGFKPTTPLNLSATNVTATSADLTWDASNALNTVAEYYILQDGVVVQTIDATSANVTGLTPNTSYTYAVQAIDGSGNLSEQSNEVEITTGTTDIEKSTSNGISIYPNPTTRKVNIEVESSGICNLRIINITGKLVMEMNFEKGTSFNKAQLGGEGLYIIEIKTDTNKYYDRLIVQ